MKMLTCPRMRFISTGVSRGAATIPSATSRSRRFRALTPARPSETQRSTPRLGKQVYVQV